MSNPNIFTVPYRLPDGTTARIRHDAGDYIHAAITFTLAGGRVTYIDRIDPPTVLTWNGTEAVRS